MDYQCKQYTQYKYRDGHHKEGLSTKQNVLRVYVETNVINYVWYFLSIFYSVPIHLGVKLCSVGLCFVILKFLFMFCFRSRLFVMECVI